MMTTSQPPPPEGLAPAYGSALDFRVGDRISFYHGLRRTSGVVYALTPPRENPMGIPVAAQLSVTVQFGRNHVNLGVDAEYHHARVTRRQNTLVDQTANE